VALDPRHRPQTVDRPASTVRRDWWRGPQEAHLLDAGRHRYRQLTWEEMAILQGFEPSWFAVRGLTKTNRISAIGDAVPPPLAGALFESLNENWPWGQRTAVEVCAGSGGLASASTEALRHLALIDRSAVSCKILRDGKPWASEAVHHGEVADFPWNSVRGRVGLLSGGPPCQPWSQGGRRKGFRDPRDLLGNLHKIVAEVEPEAILIENVPGLASLSNRAYFSAILANLRRPAPGLRYGVMAGIFNAADFGVPQTRRRLFFVGLREESSATARKVLDQVASRRTHRSPGVADPRREPWLTVGDALGSREDPGGWRRWIDGYGQVETQLG
jgi:site-specific DNA-cytosine methylase